VQVLNSPERAIAVNGNSLTVSNVIVNNGRFSPAVLVFSH
jgi:hypothetical protein